MSNLDKKLNIFYYMQTLNKPMNKHILFALDNLLDDYISHHSKTFVMRLDVHLPKEMQQDKILHFNHRFIEKEKNAGYDPKYAMAREVSRKGNIHYHMALFLNGNKTKSIYRHVMNAEKVLRNVVGEEKQGEAWIERCDKTFKNGILIRRNDPDRKARMEVERQISYLAKSEQKEGVQGKTFFTSRLNRTPYKNDPK